MSFPQSPADRATQVVNGIKYVYSLETNSWRRDFNNALDRLFLVGGNQADTINTSSGDLIVYGGGRFRKNLIVNENLIVNGSIFGVVSTATTTINLKDGAAGSLVYQSGTSTTAFIPIQTAGSILVSNGVIPVWTATAQISVAYANTSSNISGGAQYRVPYQSNTSTTTFSPYFTFNGNTLSLTSSTSSTSVTSGALVVTGGVGIGGDLYIGGNLQINGTRTFVNTVDLEVTDKNILLSKGSINAAASDLAGISIDGPAVKPQLYYSASNNSWNSNLLFVATSASFTVGIESTSVTSGTLRVTGGAGISGNVWAGRFRGPHTGAVGDVTPDTGAFTTISGTSTVTSTSSSTGALTILGGVGIAKDVSIGGSLTVWSLIYGTATNAQYANTSTRAYGADFATAATSSTRAIFADFASTSTNIAGGLVTQIPYQSNTSTTTFSSNLTYNGSTLKLQVTNSDVLPQGIYALDLKNTSINQSPILRLAGSSGGIAMISSFNTLRIMQDAVTLTNTLMSIGLTGVNITSLSASTATTNGALVVGGGLGVGGDVFAGSFNGPINGDVTGNVTGNLNGKIGNLSPNTAVFTTATTTDLTSSGTANFVRVNVTATTISATTATGALVITGGVGIGGRLNVGGGVYMAGTLVTTIVNVPISATATGTPGQIAADASYTYICYATNSWRRWANSTW
jgi:hypothetical protein